MTDSTSSVKLKVSGEKLKMSEPPPCKYPRPQLRGLLLKQIKRNLTITLPLVAFIGLCYKTLHNDRNKKIYADFYRNYDINAEFNKIRNHGLFDSCEPDP